LALGSATGDEAFRESFSQGMQAHGWVQGENVTLEWRFADGDMERLPTLVAELVRLPVDVLVTQAFATVVARRETSSIPIVMVGVVDPVGQGLIASLAHPEGNVTGLSILDRELT